MHDAVIDEDFVCKKYAPIHEPFKQELFANFVREINNKGVSTLLHRMTSYVGFVFFF